MSRARVLAALIVSAAAAWIWGCETDAVAVEDCREIEQARCRAAQHCDFDIDSDEDVVDCERFARDHCLHGFQVDEGPGATALRDCVDAIEAAGSCALASGADALISTCPDPEPLAGPSPATMVCDAVQDPETLTACAFLVPEPEEPPPPPEDAAPAADAPTD